jgi:hypothetical protein
MKFAERKKLKFHENVVQSKIENANHSIPLSIGSI